ncbi:hypothetical protein [Mycolicibacterium mageritense]|uniref:hypothetical protein n=1 Tax=Mycolicibacterium mageritense TaxID=53462 RepID=UPI001E448491|nr:hypothetical protein [Mycolicibacterium mageritense]MCC9182586.1 hypothetical protein [Mycolicibacterium mageritense]
MTFLGELDGLSSPKPRRFNLDGAIEEFTAAATTWAVVTTAWMIGIATDDDRDEAFGRLQRAFAVVDWERGRAISQGIVPALPWLDGTPTADYDDETVEALLRGAR